MGDLTEGFADGVPPTPALSVQPVEPGGRKAYLVALATAQAAAFVRSVVLARLLGPEQMGLAAIIIVTASFFDAITDTGADDFLVQDRFGGTADALQLIHLVAVMKGALVALLLILFAAPIATLTNAPQAAHALAALAIVPFLNGFTNYDFRISQRHHQFGPEAKMMLVSEATGVVATVVAAVVVQNFTAVLYGLAVRAVASVAVSHAVARQGYRLRFCKELAERFWTFSVPLMANGLLIFIATQSDRVIISRHLGLAELGRYTIVLLIGLYPGLTIMRFVGAIYLPMIAGARDEPARMRRVSDELESGAVILGAAVAIGFSFVVPAVLPILFGSKFATSSTVLALLGLLTCWRMMKTAPTTVAMAIGRTNVMLINNLLRLSGICAAIAGVYLIGGIAGVAAGLIAGEVVANVAASVLLTRATGWSMRAPALRYVFVVTLGLTLILRSYAADNGLTMLGVGAAISCFALAAVGMWHERKTLSQIGILVRLRMKI
jgi:O-antigen/teichoic acid export membrane protein